MTISLRRRTIYKNITELLRSKLHISNFFPGGVEDIESCTFNTIRDREAPLNKVDIDELFNVLDVTNISFCGGGSFGLIFLIECNAPSIRGYKIAMKVVGIPKHQEVEYHQVAIKKMKKMKKKHKKNIDIMTAEVASNFNPENVERIVLEIMNNKFLLNMKTPHLVYYYGSFLTPIKRFTEFHNEGNDKILGKKRFLTFLDDLGSRIDEDSNAIVSLNEWEDNGDLLSYLKDNLSKLNDFQWKAILFQIIFTLATIQKMYPNFKHNDLKSNNILMYKLISDDTDNRTKVIEYKYSNQKFLVFNIHAMCAIWDFDFATIQGLVDNNKITNTKWANNLFINDTPNLYSDLHYFMNSLGAHLPEFEKLIPSETLKFFEDIIPPHLRYYNNRLSDEKDSDGKYRPSYQIRLTENVEFTTPEKIILTHPYFDIFRVEPKYK